MSKSSKHKIKYIQVKTIYTKLPSDKDEPSTLDVAVLSQEEQEVVVVADFNNKALKAFWADPKLKSDRTSCLEFKHHPRRVATVTDSQVVVSFWEEPLVAIVNVCPHLRLDAIVETQSKQCGIAVIPGTSNMEDYRFVFSNGKQIATYDPDGYLLKRLSVNKPGNQYFPVPWYLSPTSNNNILVSDFEKGGLTCLTQDGEVLWSYQTDGISRGVTCDSDGYIYLVEGVTNQVTLLTPNGKFVSSILCEETRPSCIYGVAFGKSGKMYLSEYHGHIGIFSTIKHTVL